MSRTFWRHLISFRWWENSLQIRSSMSLSLKKYPSRSIWSTKRPYHPNFSKTEKFPIKSQEAKLMRENYLKYKKWQKELIPNLQQEGLIRFSKNIRIMRLTIRKLWEHLWKNWKARSNSTKRKSYREKNAQEKTVHKRLRNNRIWREKTRKTSQKYWRRFPRAKDQQRTVFYHRLLLYWTKSAQQTRKRNKKHANHKKQAQRAVGKRHALVKRRSVQPCHVQNPTPLRKPARNRQNSSSPRR